MRVLAEFEANRLRVTDSKASSAGAIEVLVNGGLIREVGIEA